MANKKEKSAKTNKASNGKAVATGSNQLFEIPSAHDGGEGGFSHLVVGTDLLDACVRLATARFAEKHPNHKVEDHHEFIGFEAGRYAGRCLAKKVVGSPTNKEPGVIEINHSISQASN